MAFPSMQQAEGLKIGLYIALPSGLRELDAENSLWPLPRGPEGDGPLLYYGPYLNTLAKFLTQESSTPLIHALKHHTGRSVSCADIRSLDVISEKHGAFYNVVRVKVSLSDLICSFALNSAAAPSQHAVMDREIQILTELNALFDPPLLPRVYFHGMTQYDPGDGPSRTLHLLLADWFDGFHEFHTSIRPDGAPGVVVWGADGVRRFLERHQVRELYKQSSRLLTLYFDLESGRQIYPWHHAAGDFVVRCVDDTVDVRLITVRDYRRLIAQEGALDPVLVLVHFFLNLTLRMRLDRFDGTGEIAWADPSCLEATLDGFLEGCRQKQQHFPGFPDPSAVLALLKAFDEAEWLGLLEVVSPDGFIDSDEGDFVGPHLAEHARELTETLRIHES